MSEYSSDDDTFIENMGYRDSTHSSNYSLASSTDSNSNSETSNSSPVIALSTISNSDYESNSEQDMELYDWDEYNEDDPIVDNIYQDDKDHLDSDKRDGCYYVGIYKHISSSGNMLYVNSVSGNVFTQYPYDKIRDYLYYYSIMLHRCSEVEIMQLYIRKEVYYVVVKTFWLRIIQRTWKRKYQDYKERQQQKMLPQNIRYREINGKYPKNLEYLPTIRGMLARYKQE